MSGHLIARPAVLASCPGCRRHILAAVSSGCHVYADPDSLTTAAEIAARLNDRTIFEIHVIAQRMYLEYRDLGRIKAARDHPVVGEHVCPSGRRPHVKLGDELIVFGKKKESPIKERAHYATDETIPF